MVDLSISNLFNVNGLVFVITGGGSGLGEFMALALDRNGASKVFILGRRQQSLEKVAAKAVNGSVIPVQADVASIESLKNAATIVAKQTPFVNVVVANGGVSGPITNWPPAPSNPDVADVQDKYWALPIEETRKMFDINLFGVYYTFTAFVQLLDAGNTNSASRGKTDFIQSQFITVDSIAAYSRLGLVSHFYPSGKAALAHLTKILATEWAKKGIRVNAITPGQYLTEMTEFASNGKDTTQPGSIPFEQLPMTRRGGAEDIAGVILFLTSKAGSFLNGSVLLSDGGQLSLEPSTY
ncbi:short chain dehydrogenase/reductase family [Lophiotrema nucula]|uniref:Short chain dehydrogenase/reductase family n=1 Tax=Lophiotrema nucula TaxID=690887 RepID=A0A6A5YY89_9PLEO|nr:short chain dehydrogenase/reductase family [Lophiotrema nucula]